MDVNTDFVYKAAEEAKKGIKTGLLKVPLALRSKGISINSLNEYALTMSEKKNLQKRTNNLRKEGLEGITRSLSTMFNSEKASPFRPIQSPVVQRVITPLSPAFSAVPEYKPMISPNTLSYRTTPVSSLESASMNVEDELRGGKKKRRLTRRKHKRRRYSRRN